MNEIAYSHHFNFIMKQQTGYALVLSWPETPCKKAGGWYDELMERTKIPKNGYYKVGHAAIVIINGETGQCDYFDFGRYVTPKGLGRVRSEEHDFDLHINTKICFDDCFDHYLKPTNLNELLVELTNNASCHGNGRLTYEYEKIDYHSAINTATTMQRKGFIKYGPFVRGGTNCSRFVRTVLRAGLLNNIKKVRLSLLLFTTPTPQFNVRVVGKSNNTDKIYRSFNRPMETIKIPEESKELNGIGSSSFFEIQETEIDQYYTILRISNLGKKESYGYYKCSHSHFNLKEIHFKIIYPSNSKIVNIETTDRQINFTKIEEASYLQLLGKQRDIQPKYSYALNTAL